MKPILQYRVVGQPGYAHFKVRREVLREQGGRTWRLYMQVGPVPRSDNFRLVTPRKTKVVGGMNPERENVFTNPASAAQLQE